jgi:hypothetical protein
LGVFFLLYILDLYFLLTLRFPVDRAFEEQRKKN